MDWYEKVIGGYMTTKEIVYTTGINPIREIVTDYAILRTDGTLVIFEGFFWNGANASIDFRFMHRGSCIHAALCMMIGTGGLSQSRRKAVDKLFREMCRADAKYEWMANLAFKFIRLFVGLKYGKD